MFAKKLMEKEKEKENFNLPKYNKKILLYYSSHATTYLCWVCYLLETKPIENIKSDVFFPQFSATKWSIMVLFGLM